MRRTVITSLQRWLLSLDIALTVGIYHSVQKAHGPGWSWWAYVVIVAGLILAPVILRARTETDAEKRERTHAGRARRWTRQVNRKWQADRKAWLRNQGRRDR
ncbi:hypothetical protein NY057_05110 [Curtobacterium flaccumfaciens]|uniref:hypothetical protein n=1 Tax=Curtobacterium flaccumfaciens TaxID=2035 RepID=UPI00220E5CA8|nr:hypothetical protein [Curtobacterium flaccumfaciens]UWD83625.1 hypothetical protein NY057_05110 [Curtobacterium flaccumfaciens]